jgi:glutathione S-transferase
MAKLTLYHASPSRSSIVRWMLEETGEPYDLHLLKLAEGEQMKPDNLPSIRWERCQHFGTATR